jgi:hypothetical protein
MLNLIKPGHVLRFGTDPGTIISPPATNEGNDNTLETPWPRTSDLGAMQCLSHPSGALGGVAAQVVNGLRTTPGSKSRSLSYSAVGRAFGSSNRLIGVENCSFVGYVDGQTNYIESNATVFSKDFSGCLMVAYLVGGRRRVAHAAASSVPAMDCKRAFLKTIRDNGATLIGWFQPFIGNRDNDHKIDAYQAVKSHKNLSWDVA